MCDFVVAIQHIGIEGGAPFQIIFLLILVTAPVLHHHSSPLHFVHPFPVDSAHMLFVSNATSYWPPLAYSITVVAVSGFTLQLLPFLISLTPCLFKVQSMKLEPVVFWQGPRLLPKLARPQRSHGPVRPAVCMKALNIQWNLWYLIWIKL